MMRLGKYDSKWMLFVALVALSATVLTGCARSEFDKTPIDTSAKPVQTATKPVPQQQEPETKPGKKDLTVLSPELPASSSNDSTAPKPDASHSSEASPSDKDQDDETPAAPPSYDVHEPYDASKPTLMGFSIADRKDAVLHRFGSPEKELKMNDGVETLSVHHYPGFIIGTSSNGHIVFIEVNDGGVNPGLNQLRVGHTVSAAQQALGTPDSLNDYVMVYNSAGNVLKLDLDPEHGIVRSIKLFSET